MILITKEEAMAVRAKFPKALITRTCRQKSKRHRYYCEESKSAMKIIRAMRQKGG